MCFRNWYFTSRLFSTRKNESTSYQFSREQHPHMVPSGFRCKSTKKFSEQKTSPRLALRSFPPFLKNICDFQCSKQNVSPKQQFHAISLAFKWVGPQHFASKFRHSLRSSPQFKDGEVKLGKTRIFSSNLI